MPRPFPLPDEIADRRTGLFGGTGTVLVWDLLGGAPAEPFSAVLACELEPGASVGTHVQQRDPEIVLCLAGEGTAIVGGEAYELGPGAAVYLPFGTSLALRNRSDGAPLFYLIIKARQAREGS
jgi:quercetin dioxygenase-like cupin family protein